MKQLTLLLLLCITLAQGAEPTFEPKAVEKKDGWQPVNENEVVIAGVAKWNFTIGHDRLIYVVKNESEKAIRVPEQQVIIYNRYGIALAKYKTKVVLVGVGGVRSDKDYEKFYPLDMIFKYSDIQLPSDWGEAVWLEMLAPKEE